MLRRYRRATGDPEVVVIGSQSILGSYPDRTLPRDVVLSTEVDLLPLDDPDEAKADTVDWVIGELSPFHEQHGVYAQGVGPATALLPDGWLDRVVPYKPSAMSPTAWCLEPHDLAASKLAAGRDKDLPFVRSLVKARLLNPDILRDRIEDLPIDPTKRRNLLAQVEAIRLAADTVTLTVVERPLPHSRPDPSRLGGTAKGQWHIGP